MTNNDENTGSFCAAKGFSWMDVSGPDAVKFLQGQSTINCETLTPNSLHPGGVCNPKGRLVANFFASRIDNGIRLFMRESLIEPLTQHLAKYKVFFKCELIPADTAQTLYFAPTHSGETPAQAFVWTPQNDHEVNANTEQSDHARKPALQLLISETPLAQTTSHPAMLSGFYYQLVSEGFALFDGAESEQFLPHDLAFNRLNAVDYQKGCFTGQEIIARMHYKAKLKSHLCLLVVEGRFTTLDECQLSETWRLTCGEKLLSEEKPCGQMITAVPSLEAKSSLILANLREEAQNLQFFQPDGENQPILKVTSVNRLS